MLLSLTASEQAVLYHFKTFNSKNTQKKTKHTHTHTHTDRQRESERERARERERERETRVATGASNIGVNRTQLAIKRRTRSNGWGIAVCVDDHSHILLGSWNTSLKRKDFKCARTSHA